jgi:hypothetical protein
MDLSSRFLSLFLSFSQNSHAHCQTPNVQVSNLIIENFNNLYARIKKILKTQTHTKNKLKLFCYMIQLKAYGPHINALIPAILFHSIFIIIAALTSFFSVLVFNICHSSYKTIIANRLQNKL